MTEVDVEQTVLPEQEVHVSPEVMDTFNSWFMCVFGWSWIVFACLVVLYFL